MIDELKVGDILWQMYGTRQNDEIRWYAHPKCIEKIDEHKYLFGGGGGCSKNSVGKNYYRTREEAISQFMEHHGSLVQKLDDIEKATVDVVPKGMADNVHNLPRTDWQDKRIVKWDTVNVAGVYVGTIENMMNVTEAISWHSEPMGDFDYISLTLSEIYEQVSKLEIMKGGLRIITVFQEGPLDGDIYQCGNYSEADKWVQIGTLRGYA